jgi:hypothetical protein
VSMPFASDGEMAGRVSTVSMGRPFKENHHGAG